MNPSDFHDKKNTFNGNEQQNGISRSTATRTGTGKKTGNEQANPNSFSDSRQATPVLPTGGGAIRGIGEKFQANPVTGTASFTVPVTISEGRDGFTPQLAMSYDSGNGNGIFGLGWNIGFPSITRKTDKGLPQYDDTPGNESDTFILSGAEDLVPVTDTDGEPIGRDTVGYNIYRYQPRVEGLFALIERWVDKETGISHWRSVSKENITSVYGLTPEARIADPENTGKIFSWMIQESWDAKGNLMRFVYKREDGKNIPEECHEKHRIQKALFANIYPEKVLYGNITMCSPSSDRSNYTGDFHFKLQFDYGVENGEWICRRDPFSYYKAGFEIRTYRLCRKIDMYHYFPQIADRETLVRSTRLKYDITSSFTLLKEITHYGYSGTEEDHYPPLLFSYTKAEIAEQLKRVPYEEIKRIPAGIDGSDYQWADLYSEGISGILSMNNQAWYFMPNYGDRQFTESCAESAPDFGSMKPEVPRPAAANNRKNTFRLNDVDSDGLPELVIQGDGVNGFYSRDNNGKWLNFSNFEQYPKINFNDNNLRFMDLSGDGLADVVVSKGDHFDIYFSEGKKGFGHFKRVRCGHEHGNAPRIVFSDPERRIFLADMSGDGLTDIVRISRQSIVYWPNLGYGRFGEMVTMGNPPLLDHPDQFDTRYIHLTDVDGTGTTDLLYISKNGIRYYKNLSGNSWEEQILPSTIACRVTRQTYIQNVDLLGNGTQCIVISTSLPGKEKEMWYWELTSGIKPFLLEEIDNHMGGITRLHYSPSTKFYIRDKKCGNPWTTSLPFPVQVLEKVEVLDRVAGSRFTSRYAYHHGYYDQAEREFRGFGMVEQWDSESYSEIANTIPGVTDDTLYVAPAYTKTWFHTGFFKDRNTISRLYEEEFYQGDPQAWTLPDTLLPDGLTAAEMREACRALKGSVLRTELYALDGNPENAGSMEKEKRPYIIEEKSYQLTCLQPKDRNKHAVFLKTDGEILSYHYEREICDPRICHTLIMATDEYGNILQQADIAYPRRNSADIPEQDFIVATCTLNEFINITGENRLLGIPSQTRQYQVHHSLTFSEKITREKAISMAAAAPGIDFAEDPDGTLQARLIQHRYYRYWNEDISGPLPPGTVASHALLYRQYTLKFTALLIEKIYGTKSGTVTDLLGTEGKYIRNDDAGNGHWYKVSDITYYDPDIFFLPVEIEDPFLTEGNSRGNITKITYDDSGILPVRVTDAPGHETMIENDYRVLQPCKITDPNGNRKAVEFNALGMVITLAVMGKENEETGDTPEKPGEEYRYLLHSWSESNHTIPVHTHIKKRKVHRENEWLESFIYTDGLGNEIMSKTRAADGTGTDAIEGERWLATGKVILDNKGNPVKQYEPWFSDNSGFEYEAHGVTPVMHYDPLGRLISTDFPDGTKNRVEFTVWQQKNFDRNDCDNSSPHFNTPQILDMDILGRPFRITDDNGDFGDSCVTRNTLDIAGRIVGVTDGLGRLATQNRYTLTGETPAYVHNIDSGERWLLNDTADKPLRKWDSREHTFRYTYDELQRPLKTLLRKGEQPEINTEQIIYGDDALRNNIGQIAEIMAQDGKTSFEYNFKGNVIRQEKRFTEEFNVTIDWNFLVSLPQNLVFTQTMEYNALNLLTKAIISDGTELHYIYDKRGKLQKLFQDTTEHITNITYNPKDQRENIYYGNNTKTEYTYHAQNFRLVRLLTTRNNGQDFLQDLNYTYDSVGNITDIRDNAQQTEFINNQEISPEMKYTYDALYRLLTATGRELAGIGTPSDKDYPYSHQTPGNAIRNYNHTYSYDVLGNLISNAWRTNIYDEDKNRLLRHNDQTVDQYTYDSHGNMTIMPHLSTMIWNHKDQLTCTGNGTYTSYYIYDIEGNRTRKVIKKGNVIEETFYMDTYEVYKKTTNKTLTTERHTLHIYDIELPKTNEEQEKQKESNPTDIKNRNVYNKTQCFVLVQSLTVNNSQPITLQTITRYQYCDHLGSSILELDASGLLVSYEEYYPFGMTSYRKSTSNIEISLKRYKFVGKEKDDESGLYYFGARYYAAWLGCWISVDPLAYQYSQLSSYVYCADNPIKLIDPDGRSFEDSSSFLDKPKAQIPIECNKNLETDNENGSSIYREKDSTKKAERLADKYLQNEYLIEALTIVMEAMLEITEIGDLLTITREKMIESYGTSEAKRANEVYSKVISVVKDIKENFKDETLTIAIVKVTAVLAVKTMSLQVENNILEKRIKSLNMNIYYNKIAPSERPNRGGFGGAGARGEF